MERMAGGRYKQIAAGMVDAPCNYMGNKITCYTEILSIYCIYILCIYIYIQTYIYIYIYIYLNEKDVDRRQTAKLSLMRLSFVLNGVQY